MLNIFVNPSSRSSFKALVVAFCLILSWEAVYITGGTSHALPYLFLAPIVLAAWYWTINTSLLVALISGILCGPFMYLDTPTSTPQPWQNILARVAIFLAFGVGIGYLLDHMKQQNLLIRRAGTELIMTLARTIELRDSYTNGHCERVASMAVAIGRKLGLSSTDLLYLEWAALIHDIGKIAIPEEILKKTGKLTDEEFGIIRRHPNLGAWALKETNFGEHMRDGVLHHHERWDGKGYPYRLGGTKIPLQGRILAVPDVWDAITSERAYRSEHSREESLQIMRDGRGTQFDPMILDIFLELIDTTIDDNEYCQ